jgi:organic radical activating enzyme
VGESANLVEIFSSVQGEGSGVGTPTLFVRFGECDLRCVWCDSAHTWRRAPECRIETARGTGRFRAVPNPLEVSDVVTAAESLDLAAHRSVSITGGEPLLQPAAVAAIARALRERGAKIHLETHGLACDALGQVIGDVDIVAMDWKLGSDVRRVGAKRGDPEPAFHDEHERFLKIARRASQVDVKVVVTPASRDDELEEMALRVARTGPEATLVVQPVTPCGGVQEAPGAERLLAIVAQLSRRVADVRLIPQTHKSYGAL